ncbi:MAG: GNAT family N-acetyltransferase [Bacteroidetes bacterium]|nr:GNAT family N-acetyltransferase [Bacteroidota bacterium]
MIIRDAKLGDEVSILGLIHELAVYEKAPNEVINTAENLSKDLFQDKVCEAIVAESDGVIVGFALYYTAYSTWKGRCLYLEDFYVQPAFRKQAIGTLLFEKVIAIAKERKVARMDWQVLDWNELALSFYRKHNAILESEWINGRFFFPNSSLEESI